MKNHAESPRAATDWAFTEASIIDKKQPSCSFVGTNVNGDVTKKSADSPVASATCDSPLIIAPLIIGTTLVSLPSHGSVSGQSPHWTDAEEKRLAAVVMAIDDVDAVYVICWW